MTIEHPVEGRALRPALVLWTGELGGAETFTVELARAMRLHGADPSLVFVQHAGPLAGRLDQLGIGYSELGLRRGRGVLRIPNRFARTVSATAPDAAILVDSGYLAAALRGGGYRAPIIGIEHGSLLQLHTLRPMKRFVRTIDRVSGTKACSVVVAVSEYMRTCLERLRPRRRIVCIPNGIDLMRFAPVNETDGTTRAGGEIIIGCGSRLAEGKGVEDVIRSLRHPPIADARLRIAGGGPRHEALRSLAESLSVNTRVDFLGPVLDMPAFWRSTDVAVVPSTSWVESFGMVAVEAMACKKPVVASANGALPSIVVDGETGRIFPPGDVRALARGIAEYAEDPALRAQHGSNGRRRCEKEFAIERTALSYLELCAELIREAAHRTKNRALRKI